MKAKLWSWYIRFIKAILILMGILIVAWVGLCLVFRDTCCDNDEEESMMLATPVPSPAPIAIVKAFP
jgi:hypothetical protein